MLEVEVPGRERFRIAHVVLDLNGTLMQGGHVPEGAAPRLSSLQEHVVVHLVTADTRGNAAEIAGRFGLTLHMVEAGQESQQKAKVLDGLGAARTVAIGNGTNDVEMVKLAALGIAVLGVEGVSGRLLLHADVLVPDICAALDFLLEPERLAATLRE